MLAVAVLLVLASLTPEVLQFDDVQYFPGAYFDDEVRQRLHQQALERWPGPCGLLQLWRAGNLAEDQRVALLLGGAAFHDPQLIPVYREAVSSESQRLRRAALYGYRDLMADGLPRVAGVVIDDASAERAADEMSAAAWTLERHPLVAMWLQAALADEGASLPGFFGLVPEREPARCFRAVDRLMRSEDLELLILAYRTSQERSSRIALMRLIEGLTFGEFVIKPKGPKAGWGDGIYDSALMWADMWIDDRLDRSCDLDYRRAVSTNLERIKAYGVDPLHPDACAVWEYILRLEKPSWWAMAARNLYECGGPWSELSVLQGDSEPNRAVRDRLLRWLGPSARERARRSRSRPR
jgi:hypothetical protein